MVSSSSLSSCNGVPHPAVPVYIRFRSRKCGRFTATEALNADSQFFTFLYFQKSETDSEKASLLQRFEVKNECEYMPGLLKLTQTESVNVFVLLEIK